MPKSKLSLKHSWFRGLDNEEQKAEMQTVVIAGSRALIRLRTIIKEDIASLEKKRVKASEYDSPNWGFKQAHTNGQLEELQRILSILPEIDE